MAIKRIFLVEDELMIRKMYHYALIEAGYDVTTVEDGEDAVNTLCAHPNYDLILLDVMLPKLDGISVLRKLKEPGSPAKDIPVFLLTNLGMEELIEEAMQLGAERYILKSNIFPDDLIKVIQSIDQDNPESNQPPADNNKENQDN